MTKFNLRMLFSILAIFAVMAFAVACGDDDDDEGDGGDTGGDQTQAPSGTITVRTLQFENWDPHFANFSQDIDHFYKVWRGLYSFNSDEETIPSMAASMPEITDGGKTYTVKLRPDLKWSDGEPLTAQDFVLGMQRSCNFKIASHYQYILTAVVGCDAYYDPKNAEKTAAEQDALLKGVGVRAVDDLTVEYKLSDPQPTFTTLLGMWPTFPAPTHLVATVDAAWPGPMENAYNGPFMPGAYTENSQMDLVINPNWAGENKPKVEKIVMKYIDDTSLAETAYRAGEIDITTANSATLDALRNDPTLSKELLSYASPTTIGIEYNVTDPLFAKPEVRLALSQATDRKTLNDVVLKGANVPTTAWIPYELSGAEEGEYDEFLGFNVDSAKENLEKAGYANGNGFPGFTLLLTDSATNHATGEFLQAEWKKHLNIDIELEFVDAPTRSGRFNSMDDQMVLGGWHQDYADAENWMLGLWETGGTINKTGTSDPAVDDLLDDARFNQNNEERVGQYREAEKLLLETANGIAPLYFRANHFLIKPYITGVKDNTTTNDSQMPSAWQPELWGIDQ
jgi:oligopeptide transport system substrate-binding protein